MYRLIQDCVKIYLIDMGRGRNEVYDIRQGMVQKIYYNQGGTIVYFVSDSTVFR